MKKAIHTGTLNDGTCFSVSKLEPSQLGQILDLQQTVLDTMAIGQFLQPLSPEEYQYILSGKGLMLGVFADDRLIAFRALLVPDTEEEHLGIDAGLDKNDLKKVIYQEITNVHPSYRGNGLQKLLAGLIMDTLTKETGRFKYVCCTVAPGNIPSLKDKFGQGMEIAALKLKYGNLLRYIFIKEIKGSGKADRTEKVSCLMSDIAGQQKLLADGFTGYSLKEKEGRHEVLYHK
ncbi:GNAT family N-acetyltransferase [Bacillus sp. 1P06AnD]|uniref:GNAT family N-acetyltransferase n=1 Tax=Bacillus sp. 1P06AnD TaxID=3132208 RepID=UPI0039A03123